VRVELHPEALAEFREATAFYEDQAAGLGRGLVEEVERLLTVLSETPTLAPEFDPPYRRLLARRFPFSVIFRILDDRCRVLAIMHQRRKPGYWTTRD